MDEAIFILAFFFTGRVSERQGLGRAQQKGMQWVKVSGPPLPSLGTDTEFTEVCRWPWSHVTCLFTRELWSDACEGSVGNKKQSACVHQRGQQDTLLGPQKKPVPPVPGSWAGILQG